MPRSSQMPRAQIPRPQLPGLEMYSNVENISDDEVDTAGKLTVEAIIHDVPKTSSPVKGASTFYI